MKKKLLSVLVSVSMILAWMPVSVLAVEDAVAVSSYEELKAGLDADSQAAEIKLSGEISFSDLGEILAIAHDVTIDLNGHSIDMGGSSFRVVSGVKATITDTSAGENKGTITSSRSSAAIIAMRGSELEVGGITIKNTGDGYGIMLHPDPSDDSVQNQQTKVKLEDTKFEADSPSGNGGIYVSGNIQGEANNCPVLTLNHVTIDVGNTSEGAGLYLAGMATTTITNSTISGAIGIGIKSGTLTVGAGTTVSGTGDYNELPPANANGINTDGSAILIEDHSSYSGNVEVVVEKGAELASTNGHAIREFTGSSGNTAAPKIEIEGGTFTSAKDNIKTDGNVVPVITGGTFSSKVTCGDGYFAIENSGTWTVTPIGKQNIEARTSGPEDDTANANYGAAYEAAGLSLSQATDGSYTLTINKAKLEAVVAAGRDDDTFKILENGSNPWQLWFGMNYKAPTGVTGIAKVSIQFDGSGDFSEPEPLNTEGGFYNYIKVYSADADGSNGRVRPVEKETAVIKWLDQSENVLAVTKAEVKVELNEGNTPDTPTPETYTVTFNSQGGSAVSSQTIEKGGKVTEPTKPTREGYTFGGWYKEAACTTEWKFNEDVVNGPVTLYAKWTSDNGGSDDSKPDPKPDPDPDPTPTPEKYTVTFNSKGGSAVSSQTIEEGGKAVEPAEPAREGYTFDGWYQEEDYKTKWDFNTDTVTKDLTLYAKWTEKTTTDDNKQVYEIRVRSSIRNGWVSVSTSYAVPDTWVTITAVPDSDYIVSWVRAVRESTGWSLSLSQWGGRYGFWMPASDVTVDVGFQIKAAYAYTYYQPPATSAQAATKAPSFTPLAVRPTVVMRDISAYSWSYPSAQWAYRNGYLDLAADGTFRLDDPVSHQQMWRIMAKWLDAPAMDDRELTNWAMQNGAAKGSPATSAMSRQDVVVYLYQCYFLMGGDVSTTGNLSGYVDGRLVTATFTRNAWTWAVDKGIISGTADGYLNPSGTVSRGEFASILMRLCQIA